MSQAEGVRNFSVFCNHVTIIPAIRAILDSPDMRLDGFIGPGHVSTVIGCRPYEWIAKNENKPIVVSSFEPLDLLQSIVMLLRQLRAGEAKVENQYKRVVPWEGNPAALRAMADVGASTRQFEKFRSLARVGKSVEAGMVRTGVPSHVRAFVTHTMTLAQSGSTEEVVAAFFYGREDIIPEMFGRLQKTLPGMTHDQARLRHFIYYIERHIELDGDSHGPMGRELLDNLVADSQQTNERALRAACNSIQARIELWNGTLSTLRAARAA